MLAVFSRCITGESSARWVAARRHDGGRALRGVIAFLFTCSRGAVPAIRRLPGASRAADQHAAIQRGRRRLAVAAHRRLVT